MKKKILILGGTGFFGTNLQQVFNPEECTVISTGIETGLNLLSRENMVQLLQAQKPDYILNMAALVGSMGYVKENPATVLSANSKLLLNLYDSITLAYGVQPIYPVIINPISNCSYPGNSTVQKEEEWWNGQIHETVQPYGFAKKLGFMLSRAYHQQFGIRTINLIFPNAYGPYDHLDPNKTHAMSGMIVRMIQASRNGDKTFTVWGSGKPVREWIYMPDAARFIKKIIWDTNMPDIQNPLNIAQEEGISIAESAMLIKKIVGYKGEIRFDLNKPDGDPVKILSKENFRFWIRDFQFTPYKQGIEETVAYYNRVL